MSDPGGPQRSTTGRGFEVYDEFTDAYGARIRVVESSAARGPCVWVFTAGGNAAAPDSVNDGSAHLTYPQAIRLRDALTTFIDEAPARWDLETGLLLTMFGDDDGI
jgi:hypothetical protein